ncbi:MAG: ATP-binding protein [Pyrinomonadaceae bacterium]
MKQTQAEAHRGRADMTPEEAKRGQSGQPESAATLRMVVAMVRRIMRADTVSVASFSLADETITWKALSGFRARVVADEKEFTRPLQGEVATRAAHAEQIMILEGIGAPDGLPASEFPLHGAEGVRDVALAPLHAHGEKLGVLIVGFRSTHSFSDDEKQLLEGLADMAALALDNARLFEHVGASKRIWEQTFDAISDGLIVHDDKTRIVRCNTRAAEMMERTPAEVVGMSSAEAFSQLFGKRASAFHMKQALHPSKSADATASATAAETPTASSFDLRAEDGRRYLVQVAPLEAMEGGAGWSVITWSDVTELAEMQEQLSRSRRLATVGQLAAGVAHEINNPLAAITTCAEATLRDVRGDESLRVIAEERDWNFYLEEIVRQALRCKAITRGLLDLARQRRARRAACAINSVLEQCVKLFQQRAGGAGVEVVVALDEEVREVATDEAMLRQVLDNLLSNAIDGFAGEAGVVTVSSKAHGERIAIEVADTGRGIPPELLTRIFDPFFTTKEAGRGSGLGLAICTTLAEALGGALTVESKPGAGSRFRLWIPRRAPDTA